MEKSIAVLIPCYNEASTIRKVVEDFKNILPKADIYVYDNNSTDHTDEIAREAGAIVRYEPIQGKGNVIRSMFREISADCYIMVDGDDTYPAESSRQMADLVLEKGVDMVIGDRLSSNYYEQNTRLFHGFGNNLVRSVINRLFHSDIRDIMTGYRALSRRFVKAFPALSKGFESETEMTVYAVEKNMLIENVEVEYRERPDDSSSKLNTFSDGFKIFRTIMRLYRDYRPMRFFGIIAAVLLLVALIMLVPILDVYTETGILSRYPMLIVCGFIVIAAIVSFFTGVILCSISARNRR